MRSATCENCATPLVGGYCHACGQEAVERDHLSVRGFGREFVREAAALDFTTLRTLGRLASPGFLTREYLAGRRRPYLSPLKLYLLSAAIFFLAAPLAGFTLEALLQHDSRGQLEALVAARQQARSLDRALLAERFDQRLQTVYTLALSVSVAVVALLLRQLFRGQRRPFGAHVVFALHYVAFLYLAAIAVGAVSRGLSAPPLAGLAMAYALVSPYLALSLRRVYEEPLGRTVLKALLILAVTFVVDNIVNALAMLLTLWLV